MGGDGPGIVRRKSGMCYRTFSLFLEKGGRIKSSSLPLRVHGFLRGIKRLSFRFIVPLNQRHFSKLYKSFWFSLISRLWVNISGGEGGKCTDGKKDFNRNKDSRDLSKLKGLFADRMKMELKCREWKNMGFLTFHPCPVSPDYIVKGRVVFNMLILFNYILWNGRCFIIVSRGIPSV